MPSSNEELRENSANLDVDDAIIKELPLEDDETGRFRRRLERGIDAQPGATSSTFRHPRSSSPGLETPSRFESSPSSLNIKNCDDDGANDDEEHVTKDEDEETQPLVRYDELERRLSNLTRELSEKFRAEFHTQKLTDSDDGTGVTIKKTIDDNKERRLSLPEDSYTFLISCKIGSLGWLFGMFVTILQVILSLLFLINIMNFSAGSDNPLDLPADVDPSVRITQVFAILISVFVQSDVRTALEMVLNRMLPGFRLDCEESILQGQTRENSFLRRVKPSKWYFASFLRGVEGILSLFTSFVLIIQSSEVFDLMLNFTAVLFLSELDELAFILAKNEYFGKNIKKEAKRVQNMYYCYDREQVDGTFRSYYHSGLLMLILATMYIGFAITCSRQEGSMKYYSCKNSSIHIEFGDVTVPSLGIFTGVYMLSENKKTSSHVVYENTAIPSAKLGFCKEYSTWTLFRNEEDDPCYFLAKSSKTKSYDIMDIEPNTWFSNDDVPLEHIKLLCHRNHTDPQTSQHAFQNRKKGCPSLYVPRNQLNGFLPDTGARNFSILTNDPVHNHPVYWGQSSLGLNLILFTGRRWVIADAGRIPQLESAKNATDLESEFVKGLESDDFRASQFPEGAIMFITDPVEAFSDAYSPDGLNWHHSLYPKKNSTGNTIFPSPDTRRSVQTFLSCSICHNQTNRCNFEGECQSDGKCDCKNSGADGLLCEVPPLGNGVCNEYFNKEFYRLDGGDCCGATCDSIRCGLEGLGEVFGTALTSSRGGNGFPKCIDDSMTDVTIIIDCPDCYQQKWNAELQLDCDSKTYLQFRYEGPMAKFINNSSETVWVGDVAKCNIRMKVNYRVQYNLRILQKVQGGNLELLETELLFEGLQPEINRSFPVVSACLLNDLFDDTSLPARNTSRYDALLWVNQQIRRGIVLPDFSCDGPLLPQLYALAVMYYSFDNSTEAQQLLDGWLSPGFHCDYWDRVNCNAESSLSQVTVESLELAGTLPTEIGYFNDLVDLTLNAGLRGALPTEIGLLIRLTSLDLSQNDLNGTIPTEIGNLSSLMSLDLSGNDFTGSLPTEIGLITSLTSLDLSRNHFTGIIPSELGVIPNLTEQYLYGNQFTDVIDSPTELPSTQPTVVCPETNRFRLSLTFDYYADEISWIIENEEGTDIVKSPDDQYSADWGDEIIETGCLEVGSYNFTLYDSAGDGLYQPGSYKLTVGGAEVLSGGAADFNDDEISIAFDVPYVPVTASPTTSPAPTVFCPEANRFQLVLELDYGVVCGGETTWDILDQQGEVVHKSPEDRYQNQQPGSNVTEMGCLETGSYNFTIYDSYGDGMTGNSEDYDYNYQKPGSYELIVGGNTVVSGDGESLGEFHEISTTFVVPYIPETTSPTMAAVPTNFPSISPAPTTTCDLEIMVDCTISEWNGIYSEWNGIGCDGVTSFPLNCNDRPFEMTFRYTGGTCNQSLNTQPRSQFHCEDFGPGNPLKPGEMTFIQAFEFGGGNIYFQGLVPVGELFSLHGPIREFTNISFWNPSEVVGINEDRSLFVLTDTQIAQIVKPQNLLQSVKFQSACFGSQNVFLTDRYGSAHLVKIGNARQGYVSTNVTASLDMNITSNEPVGLLTLFSITNQFGIVNKTGEVNGMIVDGGEIVQVSSTQVIIDISQKTRYAFQTIATGETETSGIGCFGQDFYEFIAGDPLPPNFPTLAPSPSP